MIMGYMNIPSMFIREDKAMNKKNVVLWGIGKIAEVVHFYLTEDSDYEVCAFCVDEEYRDRNEFKGLPVKCFERIEEKYSPTEYLMCIPIGYAKVNKIREEKYLEAKRKGYSFVTYISSKATYYGTPVGENTLIFENNVIQPFTSIGNNTILWSGNHIGHHTEIGNHCFITSHVVISGGVKVKDNTFLGVNATVRDSVIIEKENIIGAGAVILHDTKEKEVYTQRGTVKIDKTSEKVRI